MTVGSPRSWLFRVAPLLASLGLFGCGPTSRMDPSPLMAENDAGQLHDRPACLVFAPPEEPCRFMVGEVAEASFTIPFENVSNSAATLVEASSSCSCLDFTFDPKEVPPGGKGQVKFRMEMTGRHQEQRVAKLDLTYSCQSTFHQTRLEGVVEQRPLIKADRELLVLEQRDFQETPAAPISLASYSKSRASFAEANLSLRSGKDIKLEGPASWSEPIEENGFWVRRSNVRITLMNLAQNGPVSGVDELVVDASLGELQHTIRIPIRWCRSWTLVIEPASLILSPARSIKEVSIRGKDSVPELHSVEISIPENIQLASEPVIERDTRTVILRFQAVNFDAKHKSGEVNVVALANGRRVSLKCVLLVLPQQVKDQEAVH